jgi:hypothetical protein
MYDHILSSKYIYGRQQNVPEISYADNIALFSIDTNDSQRRVQKLDNVSGDTATLQFSLPKIFRMVVKPLEYVTPTTNDEANAATVVKCPVCERGFGNKKGLSAHLAKRRGVSYCKGSVAAEIANPAKRGDSVLDKRVKQQKRAILAAGSEKIFYNGYSIENVSWFKLLKYQG